MTQAPPKESDLGVRTASAVVMIAIAGTALWLGDWWWTAFVALVAFGVLWEWRCLVTGISSRPVRRGIWNLAGLAYVGLSGLALISMRMGSEGIFAVLQLVCMVIAVDVGAYFAGRAIGGPKIAPRISPSKTWAGLAGGAIAAGAMNIVLAWSWHSGLCEFVYPPITEPIRNRALFDGPCSLGLPPAPFLLIYGLVFGAVVAIVAQTGDFFESWMKRRAGVKDSGNLIPGHGGLFDRVDGLLAVSFVLGIFMLLSGGLAAIR